MEGEAISCLCFFSLTLRKSSGYTVLLFEGDVFRYMNDFKY